MKTSTSSFIFAALMSFVLPSHAGQYKLSFTASDFNLTFAGPSPESSISGAVFYTADSMIGSVKSLDRIDLVIGGHAYDVAEVSTEGNDIRYFGARVFGVSGVSAGFNDFKLYPNTFEYSRADLNAIFTARRLDVSLIEETGNTVPEPGTAALMFAGVTGYALRYRRRISRNRHPTMVVAVTATEE